MGLALGPTPVVPAIHPSIRAFANWAPVQIAFVIETAVYDGVYDPSGGDTGSDQCAKTGGAACEESNGVAVFVSHAEQIASGLEQAYPHTNLSFALVDYFATLEDHDDGDGQEYHVDISRFLFTPQAFDQGVVSTFQAMVLGGGWIYSDSDFSDNILDSSAITALYGTLSPGNGVDWSPSAHHVIVWMGDTAPRDPNYLENYTVSPSDSQYGWSSPCEPAFTFANLTSPICEGWVHSLSGNQSNSIAQYAQSSPACSNSVGGSCTIDMIDLNSTPTDPDSKGWPCDTTLRNSGGCPGGSLVVEDTARVLRAGCDLANATGGTWDGPSDYTCPNGDQGNLTGVFVTTNGGTPTNPYRNNPPLVGALEAVGLGRVIPVTFTESGLPAGTGWWVNLTGGPSAFSQTASLTLNASAGSDPYSVSAANKTYASPGGILTVDGAGANETLTFSRVTYPVSFNETGLPKWTNWSVSLGGTNRSSTSSTITFAEPNGTYPCSVDAGPGWAASGVTSPITVAGASVDRTVTWIMLGYRVTLSESGLPAGTEWWVNVSGGASTSSRTGELGFFQPDGTWTYSASSANRSFFSSGGTFTVDGKAISATVAFEPMNYSVTFAESSLPEGTAWWVNVTGGPVGESVGSMLPLAETNGTYVYSVASADKTYDAPGGTFTVNGNPTSESIIFSRVTYPAIFAETGLPTGTEWYANLSSGASAQASNDTLTLPTPNGTYLFAVGTPAAYGALLSSHTLTMTGAPLLESINFTTAYDVTFDVPSGAAQGASWTVYLNSSTGLSVFGHPAVPPAGLVRTATGSALTILAPNGSYGYTIVVPGYPTLTTRGTVIVQGASVLANPPSPPQTVLGLPPMSGYSVLGGIMAAIVLGVGLVVLWSRRRGTPPRPGEASPRPGSR
jgi:hypothetical protein